MMLLISSKKINVSRYIYRPCIGDALQEKIARGAVHANSSNSDLYSDKLSHTYRYRYTILGNPKTCVHHVLRPLA